MSTFLQHHTLHSHEVATMPHIASQKKARSDRIRNWMETSEELGQSYKKSQIHHHPYKSETDAVRIFCSAVMIPSETSKGHVDGQSVEETSSHHYKYAPLTLKCLGP